MTVVTPYHKKSQSKKQQVAEMFNNIAARYDFLNHLLSLGIDILWRKKAIRHVRKKYKGKNGLNILDVATGTGDFAIEALRLNPASVTGIDISEKMLEAAREKVRKISAGNRISFSLADSENLPYDAGLFNVITVGFGVRNFENLDKGLEEMYRVLAVNGVAVILEFSQPQTFPVKQLYNFYFRKILPLAGKIVSKDTRAYNYLPESVFAFPYGNQFLDRMKSAGFRNLTATPLSFGIASLYTGEK